MSEQASFTVTAYVPAVAGTQPGLIYNPNHAAEAEARLISQFDSAAKLHALVRLLVQPLQELEQAAFDVRDAFNVETAVGAQLDILGALVGATRDERSDAAFRAYVKARILANASDGAVETILSIVRALLGANLLSVTYVPGWLDGEPAHFNLQIAASVLRFPWDAAAVEPPDSVARAVADAVALAIAAGVSFWLYYQYTDDAHTFVFADGDVEQVSETQGLATDSETGTQGGALIGVEGRF